MIIDTLHGAVRYNPLHPLFVQALHWLVEHPDAVEGRYELDGTKLYVMVSSGEGRGQKCEALVLEAHRKYIDIHYTLEGTEVMGWKNLGDCSHIKSPYDEATECILFTDPPAGWYPLPAGTLAIVFPKMPTPPSAERGACANAW